jgi:hypothetical protein
MKTGTLVVLALIGLFCVVGLGYGCGALSYRQDCVNAEAGIKAQYKQSQNNYDNMWKKFKELAAVPEMYVGDMKKLWSETMSARYGQGGSKALFQWIKEHNPDLKVAVYTQLQRAIEAGRNGFAADQKQLLAKKQAYEVLLQGNRGLFYNWLLGYPKIDLDEYDIVTSTKTDEVFKSKKDDAPIQLRTPPAEAR